MLITIIRAKLLFGRPYNNDVTLFTLSLDYFTRLQ